MRDFEDIDGDCNESQQRWDDESDNWDWDDFDEEDGDSGKEGNLDFEVPDDLPF